MLIEGHSAANGVQAARIVHAARIDSRPLLRREYLIVLDVAHSDLCPVGVIRLTASTL